MTLETRFAHAGDLDIAYQVFGSGSVDLVWVPGWISHVEAMWDLPEFARFLQRLGTFSRVVDVRQARHGDVRPHDGRCNARRAHG